MTEGKMTDHEIDEMENDSPGKGQKIAGPEYDGKSRTGK